MLAGRDHQRRLVAVRGIDIAERIADAGSGMKIDEGGVAAEVGLDKPEASTAINRTIVGAANHAKLCHDGDGHGETSEAIVGDLDVVEQVIGGREVDEAGGNWEVTYRLPSSSEGINPDALV